MSPHYAGLLHKITGATDAYVVLYVRTYCSTEAEAGLTYSAHTHGIYKLNICQVWLYVFTILGRQAGKVEVPVELPCKGPSVQFLHTHCPIIIIILMLIYKPSSHICMNEQRQYCFWLGSSLGHAEELVIC